MLYEDGKRPPKPKFEDDDGQKETRYDDGHVGTRTKRKRSSKDNHHSSKKLRRTLRDENEVMKSDNKMNGHKNQLI